MGCDMLCAPAATSNPQLWHTYAVLAAGDSAVSVRPSIVDPSRIGRAALGLDVSLRLPSLSDMRPALRKPEHMNMRRLKP